MIESMFYLLGAIWLLIDLMRIIKKTFKKGDKIQ